MIWPKDKRPKAARTAKIRNLSEEAPPSICRPSRREPIKRHGISYCNGSALGLRGKFAETVNASDGTCQVVETMSALYLLLRDERKLIGRLGSPGLTHG